MNQKMNIMYCCLDRWDGSQNRIYCIQYKHLNSLRGFNCHTVCCTHFGIGRVSRPSSRTRGTPKGGDMTKKQTPAQGPLPGDETYQAANCIAL
jgi:hypothetical protein